MAVYFEMGSNLLLPSAKRYTLYAMIISYLGGEFVKVQFGDITLAFNSPSKDSKLTTARFGADIALSTLNHPDFNGVETVTHGEHAPFAIRGPGEYEVKDVTVRGFATESNYDSERRINTVYLITLESMRLCFLGALANKELQGPVQEACDEIDILFLPIGGDGVLSPADAHALAVSLEPRLIIPIHYEGIGEKDALKVFLKEAGEKQLAPLEKLTIKKKDLEGKEEEIIVLKPTQ